MSVKGEQRSVDEVRKLLRSLEEASAADDRPSNIIVLPGAESQKSAPPPTDPESDRVTTEPTVPSSTDKVVSEGVPASADRAGNNRRTMVMGACFALITASVLGFSALKEVRAPKPDVPDTSVAAQSITIASGPTASEAAPSATIAKPSASDAGEARMAEGQPSAPTGTPDQTSAQLTPTPAGAADEAKHAPSESPPSPTPTRAAETRSTDPASEREASPSGDKAADLSKSAPPLAPSQTIQQSRLPTDATAPADARPEAGRVLRKADPPRLLLPTPLTVSAGQSTSMQLVLAGEVPKGAAVVISLSKPKGYALSKGVELQFGTWSVPASDATSLTIIGTPGAAERSEVSVTLRTSAGEILAVTQSVIAITATSSAQRPAMADPSRPDEAELARLIAEGKRQLEVGHIAPARLFFRRAADAGNPEAARLLGDTFDPAKLFALGVRGVSGDLEKAVYWYERADELGDPHAKARLLSLGGR